MNRSLTPLLLATVAATLLSGPAWSRSLTEDTPASTTSQTEFVSKSAYILGPGDQVQLSMFGQPDLFPSGYRVLVDGTISLPFIGSVPVAGRSISAAEQDIALRYNRFYKRPFITMTLVNPRTVTLAVAGEVQRPGTYPLEAPDRIPTVTQLIQLAGGITQSADLRQVQVRRPQLGQPDQFLTVNLLKLLTEGDINQNVDLRDGDTVIIPATREIDLANSDLLASASFAASRSEPLNIAVIGQVYRPGPHTIRPGSAVIGEAGQQGQTSVSNTRELPTVTQAIQTAGGIKPEADVRNIQIRRRSRTGIEQLIDIDLWKLLQEGDLSQDIALQQGDTVIVPKSEVITAAEKTVLASATFSPATIDVNVVGEVVRPGVVKVAPNTPLNTAMLSAGGFNSARAKKSKVKLIRLNPDGTVSQREIKIDFDQPVNEDTNPALRNNDVVIVDRSGLTKFSDTVQGVLSPVRNGFGIFNLLRVF